MLLRTSRQRWGYLGLCEPTGEPTEGRLVGLIPTKTSGWYASNQKSSSLADVTKSSSTSQGGAGNAGRQEREHRICTPEE